MEQNIIATQSLELFPLFKIFIAQNFSQFLSWVYIAIISPILLPLVLYFVSYIKSLLDMHIFNAAKKSLKEIVKETVIESEQTILTDLKEAKKDEVITNDEYKSIFDKTLSKVLINLPSFEKDILSKRIPNLESYISSLIEAQIYQMKHTPEALKTE